MGHADTERPGAASNKPLVLVTGASGFVGRALCAALRTMDHRVRGAVREGGGNPTAGSANGFERSLIGPISGKTDWSAAVDGAAAVVHLAALTHATGHSGPDALAAYRGINLDGTRQLARAAVEAGVRRLVFMSSVKVNGERTGVCPFTESERPRPEDAYGISKWEAEQALWEISKQNGLEVVVLRAPLVYGPGVKANFLRLMHWVDRGIPLPLASLQNLRSLVYLGNLVDAIINCIDAPAAAGKTYLVSDSEDVSTPDLIRRLAASLKVPPRLLPCPPALLKIGGTITGKGAEVARLTGSLQVDSSLIRRELGWKPPFSLDEGLRETARWYRESVLPRR